MSERLLSATLRHLFLAQIIGEEFTQGRGDAETAEKNKGLLYTDNNA